MGCLKLFWVKGQTQGIKGWSKRNNQIIKYPVWFNVVWFAAQFISLVFWAPFVFTPTTYCMSKSLAHFCMVSCYIQWTTSWIHSTQYHWLTFVYLVFWLGISPRYTSNTRAAHKHEWNFFRIKLMAMLYNSYFIRHFKYKCIFHIRVNGCSRKMKHF